MKGAFIISQIRIYEMSLYIHTAWWEFGALVPLPGKWTQFHTSLTPYKKNIPTILSRTISNLRLAAEGIQGGLRESLTNVVPSKHNDNGNLLGEYEEVWFVYNTVTAIKQDVVERSHVQRRHTEPPSEVSSPSLVSRLSTDDRGNVKHRQLVQGLSPVSRVLMSSCFTGSLGFKC